MSPQSSTQHDLYWLSGWLRGTGWPESVAIAKLASECATDPDDELWSRAKRLRISHTVEGWLEGVATSAGGPRLVPDRVQRILEALKAGERKENL